MDVVELTQKLIRCPSITPKDAGCLDLIQTHLETLGFICHRLPFGGGDPKATDNLYARWGTQGKNFCFAGHTDVVPPGDLSHWSVDPFAGVIRNDCVYGRGAVDMKGAIAAFITAMTEVITHNPPQHSISLLLTSDEEGPATFGTQKVIEWLQHKSEHLDACLVGEPTNPHLLGEMIKIGRRGSLNIHLQVQGRAGHVAYPHFALNPIPPLLDYLGQLTSRPLDQGTDYFDASNLEIISVDVGNPVTNLIPALATASINIRFNSLHTGDSLIRFCQERAQSVKQQHSPQLKWIFDFKISGESFITNHKPLQDTLVKAVKKITGLTPELSTSGGTSDARFIKNICPVIEFGLINAQAHQVDEHVGVKDLLSLTTIYKEILNTYFS